MKNKVLIKLYVPELDQTFDIFVPINEAIWKITKLIIKSVYDITSGAIDPNKNYTLINRDTGEIYTNNIIIYNTNIRNATTLVLISTN